MYVPSGMTAALLRKSLFGLHTNLEAMIGESISESIVYVLDGEESLDALEPCEKTILGVKVEKRLLHRLGLPTKRQNPSMKLDTIIKGIDVDIKFTMRNNWMIPPEARGEWCLLIQADTNNNTFCAGLLCMKEHNLTKGGNRDGKVSINKYGKLEIDWLFVDSSYPVPRNQGIKQLYIQ
jgi:hypothetical protein